MLKHHFEGTSVDKESTLLPEEIELLNQIINNIVDNILMWYVDIGLKTLYCILAIWFFWHLVIRNGAGHLYTYVEGYIRNVILKKSNDIMESHPSLTGIVKFSHDCYIEEQASGYVTAFVKALFNAVCKPSDIPQSSEIVADHTMNFLSDCAKPYSMIFIILSRTLSCLSYIPLCYLMRYPLKLTRFVMRKLIKAVLAFLVERVLNT